MNEPWLVPFLETLQKDRKFKRLTASRPCRSLDSINIVRMLAENVGKNETIATAELCIWLGKYRNKLILEYALDRYEFDTVRNVVLVWILYACRCLSHAGRAPKTMLQWLTHRRLPEFETSQLLQRLIDWLQQQHKVSSSSRHQWSRELSRQWSAREIRSTVYHSHFRALLPLEAIDHAVVPSRTPRRRRRRKHLPILNTAEDWRNDDTYPNEWISDDEDDEETSCLDLFEEEDTSNLREGHCRHSNNAQDDSLSVASDDTFPDESVLEDGDWLVCIDKNHLDDDDDALWLYMEDDCGSVKSFDSDCNVQWSYKDALKNRVK